jgi:hypothetical protein
MDEGLGASEEEEKEEEEEGDEEEAGRDGVAEAIEPEICS